MNFDKASLQQGRMNAQAAEETPNSFAEVNGADQTNATNDLAKSPRRMAGQMGARAMALINDPEEVQRTATWMKQFGLSNQGIEFNQGAEANQAKMNGEQSPQQG